MRCVPRTLIAVAATVAVAATAIVAPAAAAPANGPVGSQPVYDYTQAIRERLWVQSEVDSDRDGRRDRVEVRIIRPRTAPGVRIPVIFQPSPYYAGLNDVPNHDDIDRDGAAARRATASADRAESIVFAGYLDNYFVPRGYAVVFADGLGSGGSEGCPMSGARNETLGMKAVVDWLNGRAAGVGPDGTAVRASWSTGNTGMIGVSYNGTLANAVASTGVRGLRTIVPIASISSWYDYYRANGGVVAPGGYQGEDTDVLAKAVLTRADPQVCAGTMAALERDQDRVTGDYSRFWAERDYLRDVHKVRASVLLVHGLNDWNVKTKHAGQWWDALARHRVPRKIWLHQAYHTDPFNVRRAEWLRTLHQWFDHWLLGIDTGIMREPMADVETAPTVWRTSRNWPVPGSRSTPLFLRPGGDLGAKPAGPGASEAFVDDPARTAEQLVDDGPTADPNRLRYRTAPLPGDARLSGTPTVTVRASLNGRSPYLTALLVDYGSDDRFAGLRRLPTQDCVGPGTPEDPGCFVSIGYVTERTPWKIVTRGWLDVRNRRSAAVSAPITPGRPYVLRWDLQPTDHVFKAGHRIGLVLISTDRDYTLRYRAGTAVSVGLGLSHLSVSLQR